MNHTKLLSAALAIALLPFSAIAAQNVSADLQPVSAGDLTPTTLTSSAGKALRDDRDMQPINFSWALQADAELTASTPFVAESREFWTNVDALDLEKGFRFETTAPGTIIRISPTVSAGKSRVVPSAISLSMDGRALGADAILHAADSAQMKSAGMDFGDGTLAFQLDPAVGSGSLSLAAKLAPGDYLIHVFEPESQTVAKLAASSDTAFTGGRQHATLNLFDGADRLSIKRISGALSAPDGRVFDVNFRIDASGHAVADFDLPKKASDLPGLWELHAFAAGDMNGAVVMRDAKSAFAVVAPTGRINGTLSMQQDAQGLDFQVPVKAAMGSRFELRAVLFGTTADGKMVPIAMGHAADWIDAGNGSLRLSFGNGLLKGAKAPFELRQVELFDQSRLAKLETRQQAATFDGRRGHRDLLD